MGEGFNRWLGLHQFWRVIVHDYMVFFGLCSAMVNRSIATCNVLLPDDCQQLLLPRGLQWLQLLYIQVFKKVFQWSARSFSAAFPVQRLAGNTVCNHVVFGCLSVLPVSSAIIYETCLPDQRTTSASLPSACSCVVVHTTQEALHSMHNAHASCLCLFGFS